MPPRGKPQAPAAPSVSPMWWCSITYAVPAERGPAQVPITPETDSRPSIASLSKYPSSRSAMLPVSSRVTSTAPRSSIPRRLAQQPRLPQQVLRPPRAEPGRDLVQQRAEHLADAGQVPLVPGIGVGVRGGELGDLGVPLRRVVAAAAGSRPSARGAKYGPCGYTW